MRLRSLSIIVLSAAGCALAAGEGSLRPVGADVFVGGGAVSVDDAVGGDLFAAGGTVDIDAGVVGDAIVAGGKLRFGAPVAQSVYAAGGQVNINGAVGRNLRVAGGQVELGSKANVGGNVSIAGGRVELKGVIGGHVQAAGGRVLINGSVGGDVVATSGTVALGPLARVGGKLRYRSSGSLQQDPAAQVSGGIESILSPWSEAGSSAPVTPSARRGFGWLGWLWTAGLIVLAALWLALAPRTSARTSLALRQRLGWSVGLGLVWLVCVPVLVLLIGLTIIGIPLALFALAVYLAVLPLAYVAAAVALGDWGLQRWQAARSSKPAWRTAAAAAALVLLALLGHVPWLGASVAVVLLLAGLGALLLLWRHPRPSAV